eukprot:4290694-Pyramimonas_sp.AAC.1
MEAAVSLFKRMVDTDNCELVFNVFGDASNPTRLEFYRRLGILSMYHPDNITAHYDLKLHLQVDYIVARFLRQTYQEEYAEALEAARVKAAELAKKEIAKKETAKPPPQPSSPHRNKAPSSSSRRWSPYAGTGIPAIPPGIPVKAPSEQAEEKEHQLVVGGLTRCA